VLKAEEFQVVDAKSGDDLTRQILLQISSRRVGGVPMFTSDLLSQMIRSYGNAMQGMMGSYLERQHPRLPGHPEGAAGAVAAHVRRQFAPLRRNCGRNS